jgi:hypothetical protein
MQWWQPNAGRRVASALIGFRVLPLDSLLYVVGKPALARIVVTLLFRGGHYYFSDV